MANENEKKDAENSENEEKLGQKEKYKDISIKTLAVIGLAGILALISLVIVKYSTSGMKSITSGISSAVSKILPSETRLNLTTDKYNVDSGETFNINWTAKLRHEGYFTLTYECRDGLHLEKIEKGKSEILICGKPLRINKDLRSLSLAAVSGENRYLDATIVLGFIDESKGMVAASDDILVTVVNSSLSQSPSAREESPSPVATPSLTSTPKPSEATSPSPSPKTPRKPIYQPPVERSRVIPTLIPPAEDENGQADLAIVALETGTYNKRTKSFTRRDNIDDDDTAAVRFIVVNAGTKRSGSWEFESDLPTKRRRQFSSGRQVSLLPKDRVEYILSFDEFRSGRNLDFEIKVDPDNKVKEMNESNNTARIRINVR